MTKKALTYLHSTYFPYDEKAFKGLVISHNIQMDGDPSKKVEPPVAPTPSENPLKEISYHYIRMNASPSPPFRAYPLYERLGLIAFSLSMTAEKNKDGVWKKKPNFGKWREITEMSIKQGHNAVALRTGKQFNMCAIDIDDPTKPHNIKLMELMSGCNMVAQTRKGFHYVYKFHERILQTTCDELALDTRAEGGCIFCEPTKVSNDDGEVVATYKWVKKPEENEGLTDCPIEVIEYLEALDPRFIVSAKEDSEEEVMEREEVSVETTTTEPRNDGDDVLLKIVDALPIKYLDNYNDWIKIGMILYNEGHSVADWIQVSRRSPKFKEGECEKMWSGFARERRTKLVKGATLWHYLKTENPTMFWSLMERRKDIWDLLTLQNHKDSALYFYNTFPELYLWGESLGWFALTFQNTWKHYDKSQPSGLKRKIADTLQDLCMDAKKAELARYTRTSATITNRGEQDTAMEEHKGKINIIHKAYKAFGSSDFCNGIVSFLPSFYELEDLEEKMDRNPYVFAFNSEVFDLSMCKLRSIVPTDYISTTTGYDAPKKSDAKVKAELLKFLSGLFENKDTEEYLLKVLASCLFGGNRFEEFYVFTGTGGNGKGVISELLTRAFGDYYYSVDNTLFTKPLERKDQPIPALVEARGKRIMMTTEPESDNKLQVGLLKKISGGDPIEARTLHSKHIVRYVASFKVILQTNNIPKVSSLEGGVVRRMRIIKFPFKFVAEENIVDKSIHRLGDPDVKEKHCKSEEWRNEFILLLMNAYGGVKDLKSLKPPKDVKERTDEYFDDNNPIKAWLHKFYLTTDKDEDRIPSAELKRDYMRDCHMEKCSDPYFANSMEHNNIKKKRFADGNFYLGIKRKEEID